MQIEYKIIAVPERINLLSRLEEQLLKQNITKYKVYMDSEHKGAFLNLKRAWMDRDDDTTHVLTLEEDSVICKDFDFGVREMVKRFPKKPITYYISPYNIDNNGWIQIKRIGSVCMCHPVELIDKYIKFHSKYCNTDKVADDPILAYLEYKKTYFYGYDPGLVGHDDKGNSTRNMKFNEGLERFLGKEFSSKTLDYDLNVNNPIECDYSYPLRVVSGNNNVWKSLKRRGHV